MLKNFNLILSPFYSVLENLALEQLFLVKGEDYLMLYKNQSCVVLGRNQIYSSEVNLSELFINKIPVFRRHSGGGAVYLDQGTLNYAFITDYNSEKCTYSFFNRIIIGILTELGFEDITEEGCSIFYHSFKISGTAQYKRRNRFLHHGTLLVNTDIQLLEKLFSQSPGYISRAKRSVIAKTINLLNNKPDLTMNSFENGFIRVIENQYCKSRMALKDCDFEDVKNTRKEFENKEWLFGNTPEYEFSNKILLPAGNLLAVTLSVKKGRVSDQLLSKHTELSGLDFTGCYHNYDEFFPMIYQAFGPHISVPDLNRICYQFFNCEKRA